MLTLDRLSNALSTTERRPILVDYTVGKACVMQRRNRAVKIVCTFWDDVVKSVGAIKGIDAISILARARHRGLNEHVYNGLIDLYVANRLLQRFEDSIDNTIHYEPTA